jgi:hypothetical protein
VIAEGDDKDDDDDEGLDGMGGMGAAHVQATNVMAAAGILCVCDSCLRVCLHIRKSVVIANMQLLSWLMRTCCVYVVHP